jgi:hypothetical protein
VSSGRTFNIITKGQNGSFALDSMTDKIGAGERNLDRWAINVQNTNASNGSSINIGRTGEPAIVLAPGVMYRFEGCSYHDICVNDAGNQSTIAVDGSDTLYERYRALLEPAPGYKPLKR